MMKYNKSVWLILLLIVVFLAGCQQQPTPNTPKVPEVPAVKYSLLDETTAMEEGLPGLLDYVKDQPGFLIHTTETKTYLIINMGEKPTGGFALEIDSVGLVGGVLGVTLIEKSPKPGQAVTEAFTYPQLVLIVDEDFSSVKVESDKETKYEALDIVLKTDSGRYQALSDTFELQIKISGVPNEIPAKVFALTSLQESIVPQMKLQLNTEVLFYYVERTDQLPIIVELSLFGK